MATRTAPTMGVYGAQWDCAGYSGSGNVEGLLGSLRGRTAIVAGNARGVFEEVEQLTYGAGAVAFQDKALPVFFAVNDSGMYLPHVDHWVSLHGGKLKFWAALRRDRSSKALGNTNFITHAAYDGEGTDYSWQGLSPLFALSGLFAAQIAYLMDAERIVLCGCPNDGTPRFWEVGPRSDNFDYQSKGVLEQMEKEMARLPDFKRRMRSMSGFSKEFFGDL